MHLHTHTRTHVDTHTHTLHTCTHACTHTAWSLTSWAIPSASSSSWTAGTWGWGCGGLRGSRATLSRVLSTEAGRGGRGSMANTSSLPWDKTRRLKSGYFIIPHRQFNWLLYDGDNHSGSRRVLEGLDHKSNRSSSSKVSEILTLSSTFVVLSHPFPLKHRRALSALNPSKFAELMD